MERIEAGDSRQFTMTLSVFPDATPWLAIYDSSSGVGVLVNSATASQSGATYDYYYVYTAPETRGYYYYEWNFEVYSKEYAKRGVFEVIRTDADWSGLYSTPNDVRDLYPTIDTITGLTNKKIQARISDMDSIINIRLGARYTVPFPSNTGSFPPIIGYLSKHMALIDILKNQSVKHGGDIPAWVTAREEQIEKLFGGLESGSYTLVDSSGNTYGTSVVSHIWGSKTDYHSIFSLLDAEGQQIDTDYTDELIDVLEGDA